MSDVHVRTLLAKYRTKGIFLDSNLLVLLVVGLSDFKRVETFKRTRNQGFTADDFRLLSAVISPVSRIVTTPHVLTETTNFIRELDGEAGRSALHIISEAVQTFKERRPESKHLVKTNYFLPFGLTDSGILDLPPKSYLVMSVDAQLVIALQKKGVDAINFNHLRQQSWQQQ